ncbi:MAG: NEW3 domain-containing protein [Planctomycetota bacterium]|jgi:hypothetical protein
MTTGFLLLALSTLAGDTQTLVDIDPFKAATDVLKFTFDETEDREPDGQPDDWYRRRGPGFPFFVDAEIVDDHGHIEAEEEHDDHSLRVAINGGRFAMYSPFQKAEAHIDPAFNYVFSGYVRTEGLRNDAAVLSVSFLNSRRQRLQRFVTKPVTGTHRNWVRLQAGPIEPHPDASFVVIGCHIVHGEQQDITGHVWFDDLWLGKLPRLKLLNTVRTRYLTPKDPINIEALVSGLELDSDFTLKQSVADVFGNVILKDKWDLTIKEKEVVTSADRVKQIHWPIPPQERGCYLLRTHLEREGRVMLLTETAIAVIDPADPQPGGEFGWSMPTGMGNLTNDELAFVAGEAGINWLKLPLWKSMHDQGELTPIQASELLEKLSDQSISTVGMFADPPDELRAQFARNWSGVSEVFTLPAEIWLPSVEPILARYGSAVDRWQLGGEDDYSFQGITGIDQKVARIKKQFDRIGRNSQIGIQWPHSDASDPPTDIRDLFVTINATNNEDAPGELKLSESVGGRRGRTRHWLLLDTGSPLQSLNDRAVNLVRRMLAARLAGVDGIFLADIFDPEHGLIRPDGAPDPLFLPWRTTALTLRRTEYLGSFQLPVDVENHVFTRDGEALVVFTAEEDTSFDINLGDAIDAVDIWGRRKRLPRQDGRHQVPITSVPTFFTGCSEPLAHWRVKVGFENARIPSEFGGHPDAVLGVNTFAQTVRGEIRLKLPRDWEAVPDRWELTLAPGEAFRLPTTLKLPANASLGEADVTIEFDITSDVRRRFDVYRKFEVGLGDVMVEVFERVLPDGRLAIDQVVTNATSPPEILNFKCNLSVSGIKTQTQHVTRLGLGQDRKVYYLPNAEALRGQELWLNLIQFGGRRNLNKRLIIGDSAPTDVQDEPPSELPGPTTAARPAESATR